MDSEPKQFRCTHLEFPFSVLMNNLIFISSEARLRMSKPKVCHPKPALPECSSVVRTISITSILPKTASK